MRAKITKRLVVGLKPAAKPFLVCDTELKGFVVRVEPGGTMSYFVRYRLLDGRQTQQKIGSASVFSPEQARDVAQEMLVDVAKGADPAAKRRAIRSHTLKSFLNEVYGPAVLEQKKAGVATSKRLRACFKEFLGRKLSDPTLATALVNWRAKRLKAGKTTVTVNRDLADLRAMLQWAANHDYLDANPLVKIRPLKVDRRPRVRYLEPDEERRLFEALDARQGQQRQERDSANAWRRERGYRELPSLRDVEFTDHLKPMVLLTLNTGLRRGELFSLQWSDIDLDRAMLTVRGETSKSGHTRYVPLNEEALECLRLWKPQNAKTDGYVFVGKNGGRFDTIHSSWRALMKEAGLTGFRWHDMRHDFASKLVMAGIDLYTVKELLGHSTILMTERYAHLAPAARVAAVSKLGHSNIVVLKTGAHLAPQGGGG